MASLKIKQVPSRRARNSLNQDLILDAAQKLARSGVEISLRNVASSLQCSAMAIYRHFPDKQDLLLGLLDRVIGSIDLGDQIKSWDKRLLHIAKNHLRVLQENSWAIPLLFQNPDPGPAVRKVGEAMLSALKESEVSSEMVVSTFSAILALNYGWAGFTTNKSDPLPQKLSTAPGLRDGLPETSGLWQEFENLGSSKHHEASIMKLISNSNR